MIKSKKLLKFKEISHGFFGRNGGFSTGIYKSLNCGIGSGDNKNIVRKNIIEAGQDTKKIDFGRGK